MQEKFEKKLRILLETMYGDGTVEETKDGGKKSIEESKDR